MDKNTSATSRSSGAAGTVSERAKRKGPSSRQDPGANPSQHQHIEGSFFNNTRPKRQYFCIHPEWVSENLSVQSLSINKRMQTSATFPPPQRRCKSAPPPGSRNPITWENPDVTEVRLRQTKTKTKSSSKSPSRPRPKSSAMDSIGNTDKEPFKGPKFKFEGTFFCATGSPRKQYFTIHPEWMSEYSNSSSRGAEGSAPKVPKPIPYQERLMTFPPRRCKSAPPRTRNPITWENPDVPDRR